MAPDPWRQQSGLESLPELVLRGLRAKKQNIRESPDIHRGERGGVGDVICHHYPLDGPGCEEDGQEGVSKHGQNDVPAPARTATHLALAQTALWPFLCREE